MLSEEQAMAVVSEVVQQHKALTEFLANHRTPEDLTIADTAIRTITDLKTRLHQLESQLFELQAIAGQQPAGETSLITALRAVMAEREIPHTAAAAERYLRSRGWAEYQIGWKKQPDGEAFVFRSALTIQVDADLEPFAHLKRM